MTCTIVHVCVLQEVKVHASGCAKASYFINCFVAIMIKFYRAGAYTGLSLRSVFQILSWLRSSPYLTRRFNSKHHSS